MNKLFISLLAVTTLSCGAPPPAKENNTELIVHYNGKEVHRRGSKYTSQIELRNALDNNKEVVIIFAAEWCPACELARKAIKQAKLTTPVYYLNIDEFWVAKLAKIMEIKSIPFMLHADNKGNAKAIKVGPGQIVIYLITNF